MTPPDPTFTLSPGNAPANGSLTPSKPAAPPSPAPGAAPDFRSAWQSLADGRRRQLAHKVHALQAYDADAAARLTADLDHVTAALNSPTRGPLRRLHDWLSGTYIEDAWRTLHCVESGLARHDSRASLRGQLPGYIADAKKYLPRGDRGIEQAIRWERNAPPEADLEEFRVGVADLLDRTHEASDTFHESVRSLRNRLLAWSVGGIALALVLLLIQWRSPTVEFIPQPDAVTAAPWQLLTYVMAAGLLGAFISAVPVIVRATSAGLPYRLPAQQGLLKLATGPLVSAAAVMLVAGGLTGTTFTGLPQLLALAVLFGAAQQSVTGFADRKAADVLAAKDTPATK